MMRWRDFAALSLELIALIAAGIVIWITVVSVISSPAKADDAQPTPTGPRRDYARVIVAVYHMPGTDAQQAGGLFKRRRVCPACEVAKGDEPRMMESRPDVFWGVSSDGMTPGIITTASGAEQRFRQTKADNIRLYPLFVIYSGTPGLWGDERFRMTGYQSSDYDRLMQLIDWAAEY